MITERLTLTVPAELGGKRLDKALALLCPQHSRSRIQAWIKSGSVTVNDKILRQRDTVTGGEQIRIDADYKTTDDSWSKEKIPLDIVYEDEVILVLNKPPGLIVHPGAGNPGHTLLNALLFHHSDACTVPRAGIVQRLDKDTSGIMVVAKTPSAHTFLVDQLQQRLIKREYRAVVTGRMTAGGKVDAPIGRHPVHRKKMAVVENGKPAVTHYRVLTRFNSYTYLQLTLESGRTHQIRVHLSHIRHPLVGDPVYGSRQQLTKNMSPQLRDFILAFPRQALHAYGLGLLHPVSKREMMWTIDIPDDMKQLLETLKNGNQ